MKTSKPLFVTYLVVALSLPGSGLFAQQSEADSLESLVLSVPADTTKVWLLNKLVAALREKDNNRAELFAQQAKDLAELLSYKKGLSQALENLGWILYRKGDYSKSLETSATALKVSEEIRDTAAVARCLINIGAIYYEQKQQAQAISTFKKAFDASEAIGDTASMARCYNNISYAYFGIHQIDSSFYYVRKAMALAQASKNYYFIAFAHRTLGDIQLQRGDTGEALRHFNACLDLSFRYDNTFLKSSVLHRLGDSYSRLKQYDKAWEYVRENISIAKKFGFKDELERAYKMASAIFYNKKDLAKAWQYQEAYVNLHDSLYDQRNSEQIALMQTRFDTEMKQAQIELLMKEDALKGEQIKRQKVWIYFYVGFLTLLVILAFVLFYNNSINKKAKLELEQKNREIEIQTAQLRNLNSTKDKLFSIISHDLRSPVASLRALMDLVSTSGITQEEFMDVSKAVRRNLDSVYEDLNNLLLWAQSQLNGLQASPEKFDLYQVAEEKADLFCDLASRKNIRIDNLIAPETYVFADRNHVNLILRNLIGNAIKFNRSGGSITMTSRELADAWEVSVADSGIGISSEDIPRLFNAETHFTRPGTHKEKGVGIGLLLTKEFVEINHGSIRVVSEIGKGTTFTFTLKAAKAHAYA